MNTIQKKIHHNKWEAEKAQNSIRLLISSIAFFIFFILFLIDPKYLSFIVIMGALISYSLIAYYAIKYEILSFKIRKILHMFTDTFIISFSLYYHNSMEMIAFYPVYMWIIFANGMRYGTNEMIIATIFAMVGLKISTLLNPVWNNFSDVATALSFGLILITFGYYSIAKKYHDLNKTLEEKVHDRTKEIKYILMHDKTTGLQNKYAFEKKLHQTNFKYSSLLNISDFQDCKDLYGIKNTQKIIKTLALFLKEKIETKGYIYRLDDSNLIFLSNEYLYIKSMLNDFYIDLNEYKHITLKYKYITITCNIFEKEEIIEKLFMALKHANKNNLSTVHYSEDMDTKQNVDNFIYWKDEIQQAIKEDRIIPVFQPIVNTNGDIEKYEALIRIEQLKDNQIKLISPFFFLDIAIQSGLYFKLTKIMIKKVSNIAMIIDKDFSINLTFADIINQEIIMFLETTIIQTGIGNRLIFEILESEEIENFEKVEEFIKKFRLYGVRFAIDDFGTGFSNYSRIFKMEPDYLKLDGSLIKNICTNQKAQNLVKSIVSFAQASKIKTIAEFVENRDIVDYVLDIGVDELQGYYFSEPLKFEDIISSQNDSHIKKLSLMKNEIMLSSS